MDGGTASGSGLARAQLVLPSYSVEDCVALVLHFLNSHGLSSTATVLHKEAIARQLVPSLLTPDAAKAELDECLAFCLMRLEAHAAAPQPDRTDNATARLSLRVTLQEAEGAVATEQQDAGGVAEAQSQRTQHEQTTERGVLPDGDADDVVKALLADDDDEVEFSGTSQEHKAVPPPTSTAESRPPAAATVEGVAAAAPAMRRQAEETAAAAPRRRQQWEAPPPAPRDKRASHVHDRDDRHSRGAAGAAALRLTNTAQQGGRARHVNTVEMGARGSGYHDTGAPPSSNCDPNHNHSREREHRMTDGVRGAGALGGGDAGRRRDDDRHGGGGGCGSGSGGPRDWSRGGLDAGWFAHAAPGDGGRGGWRDSGGSGGDRYWECDNRKPAETAAGVMVPVSDRITPPHNLRDRDRYRSAGAVTYGVAGRAPPHPRGGVGVEVPWQKILDKAFDVSAEAETAGGGSDAGGAGARITAVECGRAGLQVPAPVAAVAAAASLTSPTKQAVSTTFHDNARTMPPDSRRGVEWANKASEQVLFRRTSDSVQPIAAPLPVNNDVAAAPAPPSGAAVPMEAVPTPAPKAKATPSKKPAVAAPSPPPATFEVLPATTTMPPTQNAPSSTATASKEEATTPRHALAQKKSMAKAASSRAVKAKAAGTPEEKGAMVRSAQTDKGKGSGGVGMGREVMAAQMDTGQMDGMAARAAGHSGSVFARMEGLNHASGAAAGKAKSKGKGARMAEQQHGQRSTSFQVTFSTDGNPDDAGPSGEANTRAKRTREQDTTEQPAPKRRNPESVAKSAKGRKQR